MKFLRKNILRTTVTHWRTNTLIFAILVLCTAVTFIMLQNYSFSKKSYYAALTDQVKARRYMINVESEDFDSDLLNHNAMYDISLLVKNEIFHNENWSAYNAICISNINMNKTNMPEKFPDNFADMAADTETVPADEIVLPGCVIFGTEFFEANGLAVSEGRAFSGSDFGVVEGPLPIILGHEYADYYKIGDILSCSGDQATVVGFLKEKSFIVGATNADVDRSVIYPQFFPRSSEITSASLQENQLFFTFYGGVLAVKDPYMDVQKEINKITSKYGFYPIAVSSMDGSAVTNTDIVSSKNLALLFILAVTISVLSIVSVGTILYRRTQKEMPTICIYLLSGIQAWKIGLSMFLEMCFWGILAVFPTVALSNYEYGTMYIPLWQIVCFVMLIVILSCLPVLKITGKVNLDQFIRSRSE